MVTARPSSVFSSRWAECISSSGSGRAGVSQALARPWRGRSGVITLLLACKVSPAINNRCFLAGPAGKGEAQSSAQRANCFGYLPHLTDVISGTNVTSTVIDLLCSIVQSTTTPDSRLGCVTLGGRGREAVLYHQAVNAMYGCPHRCQALLARPRTPIECRKITNLPAPLTLPRQSRPLGTMLQRDRVAGFCGAGSDPGLTGGEGGLGYQAH